jgi:hypothetical protein
MAAGFRSPFFIWVGGLAAPGGVGPFPPTPTPCPCPTYGYDGSLSNNWVTDTSQCSALPLPYTIPMFRLYMLSPVISTYKTSATLTNAWQRKACG